jgi:hypothetical protein
MTEDIVTRIRTVFEDTPEVLSTLDGETYEGAEAHTHMLGMWETMKDAADRIEGLEYALRSIADTPIGAEIPDRTTIWGLAVHMRETATDALKGGTK